MSRINWITLVNLLPIWLFSTAILAEGFPSPPISIELATAAFIIGIVVTIALIWKRWMPLELIPYNLIPLILLFVFDEISTRYKTPFILACALVLTLGIIAYRSSSRSGWWRWLILLAAAGLMLILAWHAANNFWRMTSDFGYDRCFPDAPGCPPLPAEAPSWWELFFSL